MRNNQEVDFSKYDCRPLGAPSAGASYAGTMIGKNVDVLRGFGVG